MSLITVKSLLCPLRQEIVTFICIKVNDGTWTVSGNTTRIPGQRPQPWTAQQTRLCHSPQGAYGTGEHCWRRERNWTSISIRGSQGGQCPRPCLLGYDMSPQTDKKARSMQSHTVCQTTAWVIIFSGLFWRGLVRSFLLKLLSPGESAPHRIECWLLLKPLCSQVGLVGGNWVITVDESSDGFRANCSIGR